MHQDLEDIVLDLDDQVNAAIQSLDLDDAINVVEQLEERIYDILSALKDDKRRLATGE
jgi:Mg/Co/Ni transporter MgtE